MLTFNRPNPERIQRVESLLRAAAPAEKQDPSPWLRARTLARLEGQAPAPPPRLLRLLVPAAAAVALATIATTIYTARPTPTPAPVPITASLPFPLDASPMIAPAVRLVGNAIDQPLLNQAQLVLQDCKRCTRQVTSCLPFAGGG